VAGTNSASTHASVTPIVRSENPGT
jgi:hypothetical protein